MEPLAPQPGSSIDPKNTVGREHAREVALRELHAGNNLSLTDPRRMGKTVFLEYLCALAPADLAAIKIDYEGTTTSGEFLMRTVKALAQHQSLPKKALQRLTTLFDGIEIGGPAVSVKVGVSSRSATDLLLETVQAVDAHLDGKRMLIAMDEVPIAISNIAATESPEAAHQVLQTLRALRREGSGIGWIVCGSIGFHHVLRRCNATEGAINDLVDLPLGPLDEPGAEELAQRLLLGIGRSPIDHDQAAVLAALLSHTDGIAFLIHKLAHVLHDGSDAPVTVTDVEDAFEAFIDDRDQSRAVTHLLSRLEPLYLERAGQAYDVLDHVAITAPATLAETLALVDGCDPRKLLDDLIDDHYLTRRRGVLAWRYPILRRIWIHRRGLA